MPERLDWPESPGPESGVERHQEADHRHQDDGHENGLHRVRRVPDGLDEGALIGKAAGPGAQIDPIGHQPVVEQDPSRSADDHGEG